MNINEFLQYIKERFDECFAVFLCKDLQIISPSILVALTAQVKHVRREKTGSNGFRANFGSSISAGTFIGFFPMISDRFLQDPAEFDGWNLRPGSERN
jgi:hypothetical protein